MESIHETLEEARESLDLPEAVGEATPLTALSESSEPTNDGSSPRAPAERERD
jgi:hypothetical protein